MPHETRFGLKSVKIAAQTLVMLLAQVPGYLAWAAESDVRHPDSRQVYSQESPRWLRAVGKLQVPGIKMQEGRRRHHLEDCSATLVSGTTARSADIIVTAWHCLEYYSDLSKPITFTLLPASGEPISTEAYRLKDGGGMYADWAILRLYRPVSGQLVNSLGINPGTADDTRHIVMAGYSADADKGHHGSLLTYDPACKITRQSTHSSNSDCLAHKGASGGAVVQVSEQGEAWLSGIISAGDGNSISTFVPVAGFRGAISQYLK